MENFTFWNATVNASSPSMVGLTATELWIQLIVFYITISGMLIIVKLVMAAAIIRTKDLRNRFFVIVCALLFSRTLMCCQNVVMGVYRSLRTLDLVGASLSRIACHWIHFSVYFAPFLEMLLLLLLVIDRIVAIVASIYYRQLTERQATTACVVAAIGSVIVKLVPSYLGVGLGEVVPCINLNSPVHSIYSSYSQNLDLALAVIVLVLYLGLMAHLRCRLLPKMKRASQESSNQAALVAVNRQMKLLPLLRRLVLIHCGLTLVAKFLLALAPLAPEHGQRLTAYGGMVITTDLLVNAVVLLANNRELRDASFRVVGKKAGSDFGSKVRPFQSTR